MKRILALICAVLMIACVVACGQTTPPREKVNVRVMGLNGPTGMGMSQVKQKAEAGELFDNVSVTMTGAPDEVTAALISGNVDIAAVPVNLASVLYNKTEGAVRMLAVNTLGVLYIVENGTKINSISDLNGETIYATGQGSTPEYVLNYLLKQANVQCTVEYKTEHAELAALVASGEVKIALLPEPFVTTVESKNESVRTALDLNEMWKQQTGTDLCMGCLVVRDEFAKASPESVEAFMEAYAASVAFANEKPSEAAALIAEFGIMANQALAEKAIPRCHIVCQTGDEMKAIVNATYEVLFNADAKSLGGKLPGDDYFYGK